MKGINLNTGDVITTTDPTICTDNNFTTNTLEPLGCTWNQCLSQNIFNNNHFTGK